MKPKYSNDLIKVTVMQTEEVHYFTSSGRCAAWIGKQSPQIERYIATGNSMDTFLGPCKFEMVDGSEIKYKYINI